MEEVSLGLNRALDHIRERVLNIIHGNRGIRKRGIAENTEREKDTRPLLAVNSARLELLRTHDPCAFPLARCTDIIIII